MDTTLRASPPRTDWVYYSRAWQLELQPLRKPRLPQAPIGDPSVPDIVEYTTESRE